MDWTLYWRIYAWNGSSYVYDSYIPNPGVREVGILVASNIKELVLADGSQAIVKPQVKYRYRPIKFQISEASATLAISNQILNYIVYGTNVKLITHENTSLFGYFKNINRIMTFSGKNQRYKLDIEFIRTISLE